MPLSRETRKYIEKGDFASLDDQWLERLSEPPIDLEYFVGAARAVAGAGRDDRAAQLLELVDDHLKGEGDWEARLALLESAGHLLLPGGDLHPEILTTLRSLYPESPSRDGLIELVGLHRAPGDLPKTWQKVARFRTLIQFEIGTVVHFEGKGAGRVTELNLQLSKLKIELDGGTPLTVGLAAAGKLLEPLAEDHFLRRKLEDAKGIRRLAKEDPGALLQALLTSQERPMTAGEVRQALAGAVDPKSWNSWWAAARSHPQVVVSGKGARQSYGWAASSAAAGDQIIAAFDAAPLAKRLEIFRREAKRDKALKREMSEHLVRAGSELANDEPARALAVWNTLDKAGAAPADCEWSLPALLDSTRDPASWLPEIADRNLRVTAAGLVRERHEEWQAVFARWLPREADPRMLSLLADTLTEDGPNQLDPFFDDVLAHPRRYGPAFVWLVETLGREDYLGSRNPLRLLQQVVEAPAKAREAKNRTRLKKAIEEGPVLSHLLTRIDEDQAEQAEQLLKRAPVPDYQRDQLRNQLHLRFPQLRQAETDLLYALPTSIADRRRQLKQLLEEEIPANRRAIEEARALGDLRENFEYKSARQRHEYLSARVSKLQADLERARPIDPDTVDSSQVRVGTAVTLERDDESRRLAILGPWESDPDGGIVSYEAEVARGLIAKRVGDTVEIEGGSWTVREIAPAGS